MTPAEAIQVLKALHELPTLKLSLAEHQGIQEAIKTLEAATAPKAKPKKPVDSLPPSRNVRP